MSWNSVTEAQRFLQRASAYRPERGDVNFESDLAMQDLLDECYVTSFSKDKLVEFLDKASKGDIKIPENVDQATYKGAYTKGALQILKEVTGN